MNLMNLKTVNLVNMALVMAIFLVAAFVVKDWLVFQGGSGRGVIPESAKPAPMKAAPDIMAYAPVVESALFPAREKIFRPVPLLEEGPSSNGGTADFSGIVLRGTFTGEDSFAVFRRSGSEREEVIRPGEKVFGTATLLKVLRDSAIVSTGSGEVSLRMEQERPGMAPAPEPLKAAPDARGGFLAASRRVGEGQWVVDQKAVLSALDNIGQVLSDARLTPVVREGKVQGFRVTEIKPKGVFKALGLQNGDILGKVNGYEVTSPEKAVQVLTALKGESSIELDIVRGGKPMSFRYDIK